MVKRWLRYRRGRLAGPLLAILFGVLVLQCDFGSRIIVPSWHITLTIPLVNESYPLDNLASGDSTGTIRVYADSVDTNSDGSYDILLPDTLADYPGGLYITLENDLPPIRLPDNLFIIPGQNPDDLVIGPITIGALLPDELDEGIHPEPVDTSLGMADIGVNIGSKIVDNIPDATCDEPDAVRSDTISFTFGSSPEDVNFDQDVQIPGYTREIAGSYPSTDPTGCVPCGTPPPNAICDTSIFFTSTDFFNIPETQLPSFHRAFALLPDPDALPPGTPLTGFESVTVSTGQIQSILNSQMPLNARDAGLIVYTKKANGETIQIHNHYFSSISPYMEDGEDSTRLSSLAGVKLYDSLIVEFTGVIESATFDTLFFPQGIEPFFHYNFEIDIDGFQSINVFMSDTTIAFTQPLDTRSSDPSGQAFSVEIVAATFEDGLAEPDTNRLSLSVANDLAVNIDSMIIDLANFYESPADLTAGNHMIITFPLAAGATKDTIVDLDGALISNTSGNEEPLDSLDIATRVVFETVDGVVEIAYPPPDELAMDVGFGITPLKIDDLTGLFDITFPVTEQQQPLSLPGLVGGVSFGEAILSITLNNEFGITPGLGLAVKGYRGLDSVVVILDPDSVTFDPGAEGDPTSTEIRISREHVQKITTTDSAIVQSFAGQDNIVDLMALFPDRVSVGGDAQISPDGLSSISAGAEIAGTWRFEIPFLLQVQAGGVEFLPPNFSFLAELDSSTMQSLVGSNGVPDAHDALLSSKINTIISSDLGIGFIMEILVSDIKYFPFYSTRQQKAIVAADLDDDGTADTLDLNLDSLIMHPVVSTLRLEVPGGTVDPQTGLVIPGQEGLGSYEYSADFNLDEPAIIVPDSTFYQTPYAIVDTFLITRNDSATFASVEDALLFADIDAPTVADSLYNLELSADSKELHLIYTVSRYGELGWLVEPSDHYIAPKFIIGETLNPALFALGAGIDVTAFMEFILNSEPLVGSTDQDTTQ